MRFVLGLLVLSFSFASFAQSPAPETRPTCASPRLAVVGIQEETITIGTTSRFYLRYIPASYDGTQATPIVMSLHGFASSAREQMGRSDFNRLADEYGFIAIYPQGTGFPLRWDNGTSFLGFTTSLDVDFISGLLDALEAELCVDSARVYATGFSAGGGMVHRLACELADRITAIGTVAAAISELPDGCNPSRPVPLVHVHGLQDEVVPYVGQADFLPPIADWLGEWATRNACAGIDVREDGVLSEATYADCAAPIVAYTLADGGHTWPGQVGDPVGFVGPVSTAINASEAFWAFFAPLRIEDTP